MYKPGALVRRTGRNLRPNPTHQAGAVAQLISFRDDGRPEPWDYWVRLEDGTEVVWNYQTFEVIEDV